MQFCCTKSVLSLRRLSLLLAWICTCVLSACGDQATRPEVQTTTELAKRVLPASSSALDYLLWMGAEDRVIAFPTQALEYGNGIQPELERSALPRFSRFEAELCLMHRPDLVVCDASQSEETRNAIRKNGIRVLVLAELRTWKDLVENLSRVSGALFSEARVKALQSRLEKARASLADSTTKRADGALKKTSVLLYADFGASPWTAGKHTAMDIAIRLAGLVNQAAAYGLDGHAKLDPELLLARPPDLLITSERPGRAALRSSQSVRQLRLLDEGRVLEISARLLNANSPYLIELAKRLETAAESALGLRRGK